MSSSSQEPIPLDPNFRIELPSFEGPLDLLLHLIGKHELDILNLPVSFVTERYLAYLDLMKELNLDVASEYLVMAAKLIHIKSKSLLPTIPTDQEDEPEEQVDPRQELIRRLLEYQKYKKVAEDLSAREIAGRDVFTRKGEIPEASVDAPLAPIDMFKLLDAFQGVMKRIDGAQAFNINAEKISIQERMTQIVDMLSERKTCVFDELFAGAKQKYDVVVTFLALLEMTKMRILRIYQPGSRGVLHVEYRLLDSGLPSYPPDAEAFAQAVTSDAPAYAAPIPSEFTVAGAEPTDDDEEEDDASYDDEPTDDDEEEELYQ